MSLSIRHRTVVGVAFSVIAIAVNGCANGSEPTTGPTTSTGPSFSSTPCSVAGTLQLSSAQAARVDCTNGGNALTLAGGGASYIVVPQFAVSQVPMTFVPFRLNVGVGAAASLVPVSTSPVAYSLNPSMAFAAVSRRFVPSQQPGTNQRSFDRMLRARASTKVRAGIWRSPIAAPGMAASRMVIRADIAPPPVGSVRRFRVLADVSGSNFTNVDARLAFAGNSVLIYMDTLAPANGFNASQLQAFGVLFDQTLYPIDTVAFGPPSDIDQNGRVIMLMTPRVNALTPAAQCQTNGFVAGFFNEEDLGGGANDPNSNNGEVFYSMVPDPSGVASCAHNVTDVGFDVPSTFLHELQHLISFSQHVVIHNGNPEFGWLDEGLSIIAEELGSVYYEQKCPGTACRTDPTQIFPDSSQGFVTDFLFDSYEYALEPDTASVTLQDDSADGFSWRGGDWLLTRWLGDQMGNAVYKKLDQNSVTGVANIESVTGQPFPALFANFGLALYTDSLPGLPRSTAPAANRFLTRNVRQLWARLYSTSGGYGGFPFAFPLPVHVLGTDTTTVTMFPGTSSYYRLNTATSAATVTIQFSAPGGVPLSAALKPQLAVFRLPPGA